MRYLPAAIVAIYLLGVADTTTAQQGVNMQGVLIAEQLGDVLASEKFCSLKYDQGAIAAYITQHVAADDMFFAALLQSQTKGYEMDLDTMSPSAKTAHCTQIDRVARSYGFIQ